MNLLKKKENTELYRSYQELLRFNFWVFDTENMLYLMRLLIESSNEKHRY